VLSIDGRLSDIVDEGLRTLFTTLSIRHGIQSPTTTLAKQVLDVDGFQAPTPTLVDYYAGEWCSNCRTEGVLGID